MERLKSYTHYLVLILLRGGTYKLFHVKPAKFEALKTIRYHGHLYHIDHDQVVYLHGWCPWLFSNPWNPWRMVYNAAYEWYHATGLLIFREPSDPLHAIEIPEEPLKFTEQPDEKWTPAVVRGVALSKLYKDYDRKLSYGGIKLTWQMLLVLTIGLIILLMIATGRLSF